MISEIFCLVNPKIKVYVFGSIFFVYKLHLVPTQQKLNSFRQRLENLSDSSHHLGNLVL